MLLGLALSGRGNHVGYFVVEAGAGEVGVADRVYS